MTQKSTNKPRRFIASDEMWDEFQKAVEQAPDPEADRSKVIRALIRWYIGNPDSELPKRPVDK